VLVTLWPLDDLLARDFMADFHKNRTGQSGSDPAKALRDTPASADQAGRQARSDDLGPVW
jgi:CHAT domain-containing protein